MKKLITLKDIEEFMKSNQIEEIGHTKNTWGTQRYYTTITYKKD